jgi:hypothetical protein
MLAFTSDVSKLVTAAQSAGRTIMKNKILRHEGHFDCHSNKITPKMLAICYHSPLDVSIAVPTPPDIVTWITLSGRQADLTVQ